MDAREAEAVEAAIAAEQAKIKPAGGYLQALTSRNVLLLSVQYFLWSLGIYGFVFWLPSIVSAGAQSGIGLTGLISAIPYGFAAILMLINSRASDRAGNRANFVWPWLALGAVAFYGSYLIGPDHFWWSFLLLADRRRRMYAPYGPYFAYIPEFLPRQTAAASIALINSCGALGGFAGAYLIGWLNNSTGSTDASFLLMAACLGLSARDHAAGRPDQPHPRRRPGRCLMLIARIRSPPARTAAPPPTPGSSESPTGRSATTRSPTPSSPARTSASVAGPVPGTDAELLAPCRPRVVLGMAHNTGPADRLLPPQAFHKSPHSVIGPGRPSTSSPARPRWTVRPNSPSSSAPGPGT